MDAHLRPARQTHRQHRSRRRHRNFEYDDDDQLTTATNGRGQKIWNKYDALGRLIERRDGSSTGTLRASWVYDTLAQGELTSATRHQDGKTYTQTVTGYNDQYQPTGITVCIPTGHPGLTGNYTVGYTYRADGSLATMAYPPVATLPQETVTLTYTDAGDLATSVGQDTYLAAATYAWHGGNTQRLLGAGGKRIRLDTGYDAATLRTAKTQVSTERPGTPNTWDEKLTEPFGYDPAGNTTAINEVQETAGNTTITHQCFSRITCAAHRSLDHHQRHLPEHTGPSRSRRTGPVLAVLHLRQSRQPHHRHQPRPGRRHHPRLHDPSSRHEPAAHSYPSANPRGGSATSYTYDRPATSPPAPMPPAPTPTPGPPKANSSR